MRTSLATIFVILAAIVRADPLPQAPHVYVEGKAEVEVPVDWISLTVRVAGEGDTAAEAKAKADERSRALLGFARKIGIDDKDLGSRQISVHPQYRYAQMMTEKAGYLASQEISISLRDLAHYSALIDTLLEIEALAHLQTAYHSTESGEAMVRAQLAAIEDARSRAERFASAAGRRLGPVHSISEFSSRADEAALLRPARIVEDGRGMSIIPTSASIKLGTLFVPGEIRVTAYVFAVYLLED